MSLLLALAGTGAVIPMPLSSEIPPSSFVGVTTQNARNDALANGAWFRSAIARQLNHLLARHGVIIPGKSVFGRTYRNSGTDARLWVTRYRSGPNGTTLVVTVQIAPSTTGTTPRWYVKIDGVAQANNYVNTYGSATVTLDNVFEQRQEITVTAGTKHTVELWTDDNCRIVGWDLHEKQRESLTVGTDTVADYTYATALSPVFYQTAASIRQAADAVWQKLRGHHMSWNVDDPATPIAVSSTVKADTWGDPAVGPYVPTQYRNSYANENLLGGVATKSIATVCWVYGERTAGAGNVIGRFVGTNHAAGVDVTINGALGMYESTSFTLAPGSSGDQIKLQHLVSAGGTTGNIYAAGCFPLIGT